MDAETLTKTADKLAELIAKVDAGEDPDVTSAGRAFLEAAERNYRNHATKAAAESKTSAGRATVTGM